jgi:predicted secreted Zn-dependent protease
VAILEDRRVRRRAAACACAAIVGVSIGAAAAAQSDLDHWPAGVVGHTTLVYYDVHGRTFAEISADMRRLGPKVADSSFVGETRSPMTWTWRIENVRGAGCSIRDVRVTVNAQVLLPRWTPPPDTEPGVLAAWNTFIAALKTHESGHKDISAKAGSEIVSRVGDISALCSDIGNRANAIARRIVDRASEEQRTYDAVTRHGLTQGTSFGPSRASRPARATPPGRITLLGDYAALGLLAAPRPGSVRASLAAPLDRVWAALPDAFGDIGFPVNAADSTAHAAGDSLTATGAVRRFAMHELVNCRLPMLEGVDADSVPVTLFLVARLERASDSLTTVTATLQGAHRRPGGDPVACLSVGTIERRLIAAIRGRIE